MLDVNVYASTMMTKVFLPMLIEQRSNQGFSSAFVTFSSISCNKPMPFFGTTYMSTKATIDYLGQAVVSELSTHNLQAPVDFQVVYPGGVDSSLFKHEEASIWPRMKKMQGWFMQHRDKAVTHFVKVLERGYT